VENEDPVESAKASPPGDDEFDVRLGWGDDDEVSDPPPGPARAARARRDAPLHMVERWGHGADLEDDDDYDDLDPVAGGDALDEIRTSVDALRNEVSALRRAVHGSTELHDLAEQLAGLRADVTELLAADPVDDLRFDIAALRAEIAGAPTEHGSPLPIPALDPILNEIAAVRTELVALRRRTALRAKGESDSTVDEADLIARLVAERLAEGAPKPNRRT
jgi:hypothetical protein